MRVTSKSPIRTGSAADQLAGAVEEFGGIFHHFAAAVEHFAAGIGDILAGLSQSILTLLGFIGNESPRVVSALGSV
jgi:hypothetical protein